MLERDVVIFHYFSQDMIDRRIAMLKSGLVCNAVSKSEKPFFVGTLNLFGILLLGLFLLLIPV